MKQLRPSAFEATLAPLRILEQVSPPQKTSSFSSKPTSTRKKRSLISRHKKWTILTDMKGIFMMNIANCVLVCKEHTDCKLTTWAQFTDLLDLVITTSPQLTPHVTPANLSQWVEGQDLIFTTLQEVKSSHDRQDCLFCAVEELLWGMEVFPWLAVLLWTDHMDEFERSLACLGNGGDAVKALRTGAEAVCSRKRVCV
jgi:hypothetical protein